MKTYAERFKIAREGRCDGERDAIMFEGMAPGEARCGNCGWSFPPENITNEGRSIWCSTYQSYKSAITGFCKQWCHPNNCSAGVAPRWAKPYKKGRIPIRPKLSGEKRQALLKEMDEAIPRLIF